jgi:hypothetical protein
MERPRLTLITACARPQHLGQILGSVAPLRAAFDLRWYVIYDPKAAMDPRPVALREHAWIEQVSSGRPDPGGYWQKNVGLDRVQESNRSGWVYLLDDDNLIHPAFADAMLAAMAAHPGGQYFTFKQVWYDGTPFMEAHSAPHIKLGSIDTGGYAAHAEAIGWLRHGTGWRDHDGIFCAKLARKCVAEGREVHRVPVVATYYNAVTHLNRRVRR